MHHDKSSVHVFDPRGIVDQTVIPCAPRKMKLDGLRLGVLDNSKWNANKLLRGASAALNANIMFAAVMRSLSKSWASHRPRSLRLSS